MTRRSFAMFMSTVFFLYCILPATPFLSHAAYAEEVLEQKFDFGTSTSPVMEGFTKVDQTTLYTPELGYGLDRTVGSRNRSGGTALTNDFVLAASFNFMVDVPNGLYDVTVYSGDLLTGTSTTKLNVVLEGASVGTVQAKASVSEQTFRAMVLDGQLTVGLNGVSGGSAYLNGLIVRKVTVPAPAAPASVSVSGVTYMPPTASLQWSSVTDAVYYHLYRSEDAGATYSLLSRISATSYVDAAVLPRGSYSYQVTALNAFGQESQASAAASVEIVSRMNIPQPPANLAVAYVTPAGVNLRWSASDFATAYEVFRAESSEGPFTRISTVTAATYAYTDQVDTSSSHYYQVKASNEAGQSSGSNVAQSQVYTAPDSLPSGFPLKLDFGPGTVAEGYFGIQSPVLYTEELGYGFVNPSVVSLGNTGTGSNPLKDDYLNPAGTDFNLDLPNGDYSVTVTAGDYADATEVQVSVEGMSSTKIALTSKAAGEFLEQTFQIALVDGQLNISFAGTAPKINGIVINKLPDRTTGETPTVYIAGDSTVQTYDGYWQPQAGWGQMISRYFTTDLSFSNQSIGGRSTKSFIREGRLDTILRSIKPNDYFLIQFGHNDATISNPDRYASPSDYKVFLNTYIEGARQRGGIPILVTPVGRRDFNADTGQFNVSFPAYVNAMKEVAAEQQVDIVDLSALSREYYNSIGPGGTLAVFLHVPVGVYTAFPEGKEDNTHFQEYGAIQIARLVSTGIRDLGNPLSAYVTDITPPEHVPVKPTGLVAGSISNVSAMLTWNAVEGADIYKVYRKLSEDSEYSLVGTATAPTITVQGMSEGQLYELAVTAVNGKGESELSDAVVIKTKQAAFKFDFGPESAPVMEGYTGVYPNTFYTPELGYGIVDSASVSSRDRKLGSDLYRDWLGKFTTGWQFAVDVPNGLYAAKIYVGDMNGSAKTSITVEDKGQGSVTAKNSVSTKVINQISVVDGQMNFKFGSDTGIANGVEITPVLMAPSQLKEEEKSTDPEQPSVTLSWTGAEDAAHYNIYRKTADASTFQLIGTSLTNRYVDSAADVGMEYMYQVTTVDLAGMETGPAAPLAVSMIDPLVPVPATPVNLQLGTVNKLDVSFNWAASEGAKTYNIYRTDDVEKTFELIGKTKETSYTDSTVLTTIPYYYKVAAVSAGGVSELSEMLTTPVVTVLYRQAEYLDRALVAVKTDEGVYVGWKMLGTDPSDIAFNLYRDGMKVNATPITGATNILDRNGKLSSVYALKTVSASGADKTAAKETGVWDANYLSVPLQKPEDGITPNGLAYTYRANDTSVGDLDGDGTYELIVKWDPSNSKDNAHSGYTGNVYLDAYKLDGTRLWRIDLGKNIRAGAHYSQFMVYDMDGDGKAEVALKTADGTKDGTGAVIGVANADHRNSSGYILQGPEYLTVFDGLTGKALATTDYDPPRGVVGDWGDTYGNRVDRFLAAVAYLDGERPSLIFSRGYYQKTVIVAYDFKNGELVKRWRFDTNDDEIGEAYQGQGNHNLSVGDVDGDGKDEITFGGMAIDDNGKPLYNTGFGHGDAQHLGDLDPERPGLEYFDVHEHSSSPYGLELRDAKTGEVIWGVWTGLDTGRGMTADLDPSYPGEEMWAATITNAQHIPISALYSAKGEVISTTIPSSTNFGIWWDGDLSRELLDDNHIDKWDYVNHTTNRLFTAEGAASNNSTKATPNLQADLFGDWREELVLRSVDSSELRIYTTTDLTETRLRTLMHDPIYRLGIAWQNAGYNQPPHTGFFLGTGMEEPAEPQISVVGVPPLASSAPGKPVLSDNNGYTGLREGNFMVTMNMWWGNNGSQFKLYENGQLVSTKNLTDQSPSAQTVKIDIAGKKNGTYVYTGELLNAYGSTKSDPLTVTVTDAAPGQPVLSQDNWDGDGNYKVTMNMWWGTNATRYELYENGTLVDSQTLNAHTPGAQSAISVISNKAKGVYEYKAVLSNAAGETASSTITVQVRQ
ncbi:rhamnogalacturonan lyase family protein [Paenibacillus puerhi]|uniref:rhamnogalacturonan lyase family protein n=1 Tax=Paenibacillus puerhi TaxID=2692622 RepID=UPI002E2B76FC|nr:SGNH/GDSL hydrolase family protein [Paenibacillus puerhi]